MSWVAVQAFNLNDYMSYILNSLKGLVYRELYRGLLYTLLRGILGV